MKDDFKKSYLIKIAHAEIAVVEAGNPKGPAIVCLHGWLDNVASFIPLQSYLSEYRIIAFDFFGHGESAHLAVGCQYHFIDYVQDLLDVLNILGLDKPHLLGHSMGGAIALLAASVMPELFDQLVLLESFGPFTCSAEKAPELLRTAIQQNQSHRNQTAKQKSYWFDDLVKARVAVTDMQAEHASLILQRSVRQVGEGKVAWQSDARLKKSSAMRYHESDIEHFIRQIDNEMLLILAEDGLQMVAEHYQLRSKYAKHLKVETVRGGHHAHMEQPELVAKLIQAFLI